MTAPALRPIGRYHGGKWRIAPWIIGLMPPHKVYCEPFAGLGSVLLRKPRSPGEILNDLSGDVVNLFLALRDPATADRLRRACHFTPYARAEYERAATTAIAAARSGSPPIADNVERARRYLVRLAMGFGSKGTNPRTSSGFRLSVRVAHAAPAAAWETWPAFVPAICERLRGVVIEQRPAHQVMLAVDSPDTLFYLDPPYLPETRTALREGRRGIYEHEMTADEHAALLDAANVLGGLVMLSGYRSPLYDRELKRWDRAERKVRADGGKLRTECLWRNRAAMRAVGPPLWVKSSRVDDLDAGDKRSEGIL